MAGPMRIYLIFALLIPLLFSACTRDEPETPEIIGKRARTAVIRGSEARESIDRLHGLEVAAQANLIAEYGEEKKDLLYISYYEYPDSAKKGLDVMTQKIAHTRGGPFFHMVPLKQYGGNAYITLGMGATHFIFHSGHYLIWFQTSQAFGTKLPAELTELYPVKIVEG